MFYLILFFFIFKSFPYFKDRDHFFSLHFILLNFNFPYPRQTGRDELEHGHLRCGVLHRDSVRAKAQVTHSCKIYYFLLSFIKLEYFYLKIVLSLNILSLKKSSLQILVSFLKMIFSKKKNTPLDSLRLGLIQMPIENFLGQRQRALQTENDLFSNF